MDINGQVAVITGGASGLGAATAQAFAGAGAKIALLDINLAVAQQTVDKLGGIAVKCDVADEADILALFRAADQFGTLGALVNNAGVVGTTSRVDDMSAERIQRIMAVNVTGSILCAREAVKRMSTKHGGKGGGPIELVHTVEVVAAARPAGETTDAPKQLAERIQVFTAALGHILLQIIEIDRHEGNYLVIGFQRAITGKPVARRGGRKEIFRRAQDIPDRLSHGTAG